VRAQLLDSDIVVTSFGGDCERMLPPESAPRSPYRVFPMVSLQDGDCT
jgi:hypothetical protein